MTIDVKTKFSEKLVFIRHIWNGYIFKFSALFAHEVVVSAYIAVIRLWAQAVIQPGKFTHFA